MADGDRQQSYLKDVVYGAIDGGVTTFAIVAGVAGAGLSPFVIVALGLANVLADGFSMAAGNYSGTKAERDDLQRLRRLTERRIATEPERERRALREMLEELGLSGETRDAAADQLAERPKDWVELALASRYGRGMVDPHPMRAALATFGSFLVAGMVPLLPFLLAVPEAFVFSAVCTLATFFAIGTLKSRWSLAPWWRSGLETLGIGGLAAGIAYVVGTLFTL